MSEQDDSWMDRVSGLAPGIMLALVGLAMTLFDLGPGIAIGLPLLVMGILIPVAKTYQAGIENERQEARRRPERDSNSSYEIETKGYRNRRRG